MELNYDFDNLINNILIKTTGENKKKSIIKNETNTNDDMRCHTLEGLQYCYEMYKVKNNKKADFDIHKISNLDIEDKNIDKLNKYLSWNELNEELKNEKIKNFVDFNTKKYSLDIKSKNKLDKLIKNNTKNIKYNKEQAKIVDINGLIFKKENNIITFNISILKNNKKISNKIKTSRLSKLKSKVITEKKKNVLI